MDVQVKHSVRVLLQNTHTILKELQVFQILKKKEKKKEEILEKKMLNISKIYIK